jgi:hypothetical protein
MGGGARGSFAGERSRYAPIDGMDAAAKQHDHSYSAHIGDANPFSWEGMHRVREDDRKLVGDIDHEMGANGGTYSADATGYSEGQRGFFGGRVMGEDAVDWGAGKIDGIGRGVFDFVHGAEGWHSLGDAGHGIGQGLDGAGAFLGNAAGEAIHGIGQGLGTIGNLGWRGGLTAAAGLGDVAVAGAGHAASKLWSWIAD